MQFGKEKIAGAVKKCRSNQWNHRIFHGKRPKNCKNAGLYCTKAGGYLCIMYNM